MTSSSESEADSHPGGSPDHRFYKNGEKRSRRKPSKRSRVSRSDSPEAFSRRKKRYSSERSRSRSRSGSPYQETRYREEDRDNPSPSRCLGVFGLSSYTDEKDLKTVFAEYGPIDNIYLIYDREHGKSKGFGFVYFKNTDDAVEARKQTQGLEMDGRPIRVDFSLTTRPHPPTPGRYLGKTNQRNYRRFDNRSGYSGGYGGGGGGYNRGRRDGGGYGRGGGRRPSYRQSNYDDQYYDDHQESSYSSRRRRYTPSPYNSRY